MTATKLMKKPIKLFMAMSILLLQGCQNNNDEIDSMFEKEFMDTISLTNAKFYDYDFDELTPTNSYFINSKIKCLKYRMNPEEGYSTTRIYFDSNTDSIEKYVLRIVEPTSKMPYNEFIDEIYVIYPKTKKTFTFFNNKLIDSTFRKEIFEYNLEFIYTLKQMTEQNHNIKQKNDNQKTP